jgi:UDP-glucose 4-epimerase
LAEALRQLASSKVEINIIGTRHGEKLYETLCTREEMIKAEDMGDFYRVPADNRDLNYSMYFSKGEADLSKITDYHSHNTTQLNVEDVKSVLSKLPFVRKELLGESIADYLVL